MHVWQSDGGTLPQPQKSNRVQCVLWNMHGKLRATFGTRTINAWCHLNLIYVFHAVQCHVDWHFRTETLG